MSEPRNYQSIMVSSTFTDLKEHRQKAIAAIHNLRFHAEVMEFSGANAEKDVIDTSLAMVHDAAAYVGVIGHKYGQTPECGDRNPKCVSITELEFDEALRLNRPILLFIMGEGHPVPFGEGESDPEKIKKLAAFRERAKPMKGDGTVQRIYEMFYSVDDFAVKATTALAKLAQGLTPSPRTSIPPTPTETPLPVPPALRAMPRYRGSHTFVGRASQLSTLDEWCSAANQNPLLLFEAMGGSGKSLLTWHWTTECATKARDDWAGRFWYSFYEKGAVMADFCRQALSYLTAKPASEFEKQPQSKLTEQLLAQLEAKPWLIVLDGLERVLVAYHRADAAQMCDEVADSATDQIGNREPCRAIRREDDDLLTALAGAAPSKILITTRLTPLALLSASNTPIPGVRQERLPGLRPEDAEAMMRACGIKGDGVKMRDYLQRNCDCHPLVTGVIAGLINNNARAPGNFDTWLTDPKGGGALNLGKLDLVQKRNHILNYAIAGIEGDEAHVLNLLSLFPRAADYDVLVELAGTDNALDEGRLENSIARLRDHGLIQYDDGAGGYDLHPVVRGVVSGRMDKATSDVVGDALVDHFTAVPHNPWEQARTIGDVQSGIDLVATLLQLGRYEEAYNAYLGDLPVALISNLGADAEAQQLLQPFFPQGWREAPVKLPQWQVGFLLNDAAISLTEDAPDQSNDLYERAIILVIDNENINELRKLISNLAQIKNQLLTRLRLFQLTSDITSCTDNNANIFRAKFDLYTLYINLGDIETSDSLWAEIDAMGRNWDRALYRPGDVEYIRAKDLFYRSTLDENALVIAEKLAEEGLNRSTAKDLCWLRGLWQLDRGENAAAVESFDTAILMAHERGREDRECEAFGALARLLLGDVDKAHATATRLGETEDRTSIALAELWHELGDADRALAYARRGHIWAANDGEPYVHRYWLNRIRALFTKMGEAPPDVPAYDPAAHPPYEWEADVRALIEKKKAQLR